MRLAEDIDPGTLGNLLELVRKHTGMAMNEKKSAMLQVRLRPRLRALALESYRDYLDVIRNDWKEIQPFINVVTTNDTAFFRTPHVWEFFAQRFLPDWRRHHAGQTFRIWSAAASTGEEAYSIAMLCEEFRQQAPNFQYQVLATDISTEVLAAAQQGRYSRRSFDTLNASQPSLAEKYFRPHADGVRVVEELQRHMRFAEHNLLTPLLGVEGFDIVFLRNVLIYFDAESQQRMVSLAHKLMKPGAKLILGESESLRGLGNLFGYDLSLVYSATGESHE